MIAQGKRIRPSLVLLMSRACSEGSEPNEKQQRLAEITEVLIRQGQLTATILGLVRVTVTAKQSH